MNPKNRDRKLPSLKIPPPARGGGIIPLNPPSPCGRGRGGGGNLKSELFIFTPTLTLPRQWGGNNRENSISGLG